MIEQIQQRSERIGVAPSLYMDSYILDVVCAMNVLDVVCECKCGFFRHFPSYMNTFINWKYLLLLVHIEAKW